MSGNLSFLNWLTILPSLACYDDYFYSFLFSRTRNSTIWKLLKIQYLEKIKNSNYNKEFTKKRFLISKFGFKILILFNETFKVFFNKRASI